MCGIIHCKKHDTTKKAKKTIIKRFENQRTRGTEGFGYVELKKGFVVSEVRTQTEKEIMEKLEKSNADEILFHHRIPTSTPNFIEATHPIKVSNPMLKYNYYMIHNGMISNDEELRKIHLDKGFIYTTDIKKQYITRGYTYSQKMWNDSESLAIDFALAIENGGEITAKGSIAIIALQYEKETGKAISLYWGHNAGNPLCIENTKEMLCLSSETGKKIPENVLYRLDYDTETITAENKKIGEYYDYRSFGYNSFDYNSGYNYSGRTDMEEDDFIADIDDEIEYLQDEIVKANQMNDYDYAMELEIELEELKEEQKQRKLCLF